MRPHPFPLLLLLGIAVVVAACGAAATATPGRPSPAPPTAIPTGRPSLPAPTEVPGGDGETPAPTPGTFETAWGEAWDALPPAFPVPSDARPAEPGDPAGGPASGTFTTEQAPDRVVALLQAGLAAAGYSTEALSGPAEDGALVVDSVGRDPACRVQATVRPLGGLTMISILYGAACPWG
jgi:hypothetical protein